MFQKPVCWLYSGTLKSFAEEKASLGCSWMHRQSEASRFRSNSQEVSWQTWPVYSSPVRILGFSPTGEQFFFFSSALIFFVFRFFLLFFFFTEPSSKHDPFQMTSILNRWANASYAELLHFFFLRTQSASATRIQTTLLESGSLTWLMLNCVERMQKGFLSSRTLHHLSLTFQKRELYNCGYGESFSEEILLQFSQKVCHESDIFYLLETGEMATWEIFIILFESSSALCAFINLIPRGG